MCAHPQRQAIDAALVSGTPIRRIAAQFSMPASNLRRHAPHVQASVRAAQPAAAEAQRGLDLWQQLRAINGVCLETLNNARVRGDDRVVLLAVDRVLRQLELSAKLMGDMTSETTTVNVQIGEWPVLRQNIVRALEPYPEARLRVLESLNGHAGG